ncbi:hypothetical protein MAR_033111 [Mya arenaria]|uniref:Uncharacterized protein n=1 Tax=Mya arenaria TaxID=6604 RepID=A0ABY7GAI2_MYAAR|nr:hypothetical protein MAR_033111 [Mya arenaria]
MNISSLCQKNTVIQRCLCSMFGLNGKRQLLTYQLFKTVEKQKCAKNLILGRFKSSLFTSDRDTNTSNFQYDHGLEKKLMDTEELERNLRLRSCSIDVDNNVGAKAYYLTGQLAVLEQELISHFSSSLRQQGFQLILAPEIFKAPVVEAGGYNLLDPSSIYRMQPKHGTSPSDWDQDFMIVSMPVPSLKVHEQSRLEVQMWAPTLHKYLKVGSVSIHGDYCSSRLMIRCSQKSLKDSHPVHMVYAEVVDITRLVAIMLDSFNTVKT